MFSVNDEEFEQIVREAIDDIPEKYGKHIKNLAFVVQAEPNEQQRKKLKLHPGVSLFGLYEGIPLTERGSNYNLVLPDTITIFKNTIEAVCNNLAQLGIQVRQTIWHEVAHYYGLDHERINKLQKD
ncbi:MAG TPA: metallopeptidase family protein [Candidatus Saccharimonadales bacterium]|nr:metallopeptidase family protein [Candidatus Saccharimonadales bacterium]